MNGLKEKKKALDGCESRGKLWNFLFPFFKSFDEGTAWTRVRIDKRLERE